MWSRFAGRSRGGVRRKVSDPFRDRSSPFLVSGSDCHRRSDVSLPPSRPSPVSSSPTPSPVPPSTHPDFLLTRVPGQSRRALILYEAKTPRLKDSPTRPDPDRLDKGEGPPTVPRWDLRSGLGRTVGLDLCLSGPPLCDLTPLGPEDP